MKLYSVIILLILTASSQAQENIKMDKLSTQNLNLIVSPTELKQICKSISALESIISPEWEYRYYSYQNDWSPTEESCEMRNGQGDQMLIIFRVDGIVINGFAHESEMNGWADIVIEEKKSFFQKLFNSEKEQQTELVQQIWDGVVDELPKQFHDFIYGEPIKSIGTTFCIWQTKSNPKWTTGTIEYPKDDYKDGSSDLLELLDGNPLTYKNWAEEYYEKDDLKLELIENIFNGMKITKELVIKLNPDLDDFDKLKSDLDSIGYPYEI